MTWAAIVADRDGVLATAAASGGRGPLHSSGMDGAAGSSSIGTGAEHPTGHVAVPSSGQLICHPSVWRSPQTFLSHTGGDSAAPLQHSALSSTPQSLSYIPHRSIQLVIVAGWLSSSPNVMHWQLGPTRLLSPKLCHFRISWAMWCSSLCGAHWWWT